MDEGEVVGLGEALGVLYSSARCSSVMREAHTKPSELLLMSPDQLRCHSFQCSRMNRPLHFCNPNCSSAPFNQVPSEGNIPGKTYTMFPKPVRFNNCGIACTLKLPGSDLLRRLGVVGRS